MQMLNLLMMFFSYGSCKKIFLVARPLPPPPLSGRATKNELNFFAASLMRKGKIIYFNNLNYPKCLYVSF